MQVTIANADLQTLQQSGMAIGIARASPSPDVASTLAFSLDASEIVGTKVPIALNGGIYCFAATGGCDDFAVVAAQLTSQAAVDRSGVAATGAMFTYEMDSLALKTAGQTPGTLVLRNGGGPADLVLGIAEMFEGAPQLVPTLLRPVGPNLSLVFEDVSSDAYLFTISADVAVGTVLPPSLYLPAEDGDDAPASLTISPGLAVDLSDPDLSVQYDSATGTFSVADAEAALVSAQERNSPWRCRFFSSGRKARRARRTTRRLGPP